MVRGPCERILSQVIKTPAYRSESETGRGENSHHTLFARARSERMNSDETAVTEDAVRVWLVERTYGDDEQNLIILTYATPDGRRDFRKERALTSFTGDHRETPVSIAVDPDNLGTVDDADTRDRYAGEVERMQEKHEPDESL